MWFRDFLPKENLNARIMTFNHNTSWEANALRKSLYDHANDLLSELQDKSKLGHKPTDYFYRPQFRGLDNQAGPGFLFLGTSHNGTKLTAVGKMVSLLGYWKGSSTSLLELFEPGSTINEELHNDFMKFLAKDNIIERTICILESVKESLYGFPFMHAVERDSATIPGSQKIAFAKSHRSIQRFTSQDDSDYKRILIRLKEWADEAKQKILARQNELAQQKTQEQQTCLRSLHFPEMDLRANGHPGTGKSTLLKYAFKNAKQSRSQNKDVVASFFFHGRGAPIQKSSLGLFRSLLHQISDEAPDLLAEIAFKYKKKCETQSEKWEWHETKL
ncbi:MAG: hypothetical protein M1834_000913 [Cirrosporium novae-zelandiae]|nr:MAG: hypothetical protein M1834_000913 [Cirrosporium novae-zelandiae]